MVALVKNYMFGFEDVLKCVMELPRNFYVESIFSRMPRRLMWHPCPAKLLPDIIQVW